MTKRDRTDEPWEAESLAWIHAVREDEQRQRAGQPPRPMVRKDAEALAAQYGVSLAKPAAVK